MPTHPTTRPYERVILSEQYLAQRNSWYESRPEVLRQIEAVRRYFNGRILDLYGDS